MRVKSGSCQATPEEVAEFNKRTVIMAQEYIFSKTVSDELIKMIRRNKNQFTNFTIEEFPYEYIEKRISTQ